MLRPIPQEIVYKGTISDLRISAVNGTAFIDNCAAITAYADNAHKVEIYHSNGARLVGIAKEAGSGETLGSEELSNGNMEAGDPPTNWTKGGDLSTAIASVADERDGGAGSASLKLTSDLVGYGYQTKTGLTAEQLRKVTVWYKKVSGSTGKIRIMSSDRITEYYFSDGYSDTSWAEKTVYFTNPSTTYVVMGYLHPGSASSESRWDDFSVKQVTAPSTDGIIIVNAKGGATENFLTKDAGFVYNAASYTVIVKKLRG